MKKNILIIRLSALGDVAMTIPVIYSLAGAYPETNFTVLTQPAASQLFINMPDNLQVYKAEVRGRHAGIKGVFKLYKDLRKFTFDAVADFHDVLRSRLLRSLFTISGVKIAHIDKGRLEKKELTSRFHKKLRPLKSSFDRYTQVLNKLGFVFSPTFRSLYGEHKGNPALFAQIAIPQENEKWIGIAPFAKHQGKIYPVEKMEQVVAYFANQKNCKLFLLGGGESEVAILSVWLERYPNIISLASHRPGFPAELSLISHLDVMVSMDSANMHLASLVGTPVISIWGATHPYAGFLGWKQDECNIIQLSLSCRPCSVFGNKPCFRGDYACLTEITPQMIIEKIQFEVNSYESSY